MPVQVEAVYEQNDPDAFAMIAQQLESENVQAIFFPDNLVRATRFYSNFTPLMRSKLKLVGPASWDNLNYLANSRTVLEGIVFVSPFFSRSSRPLVENFVAVYRNKFGDPPDFLAAQGFDAAAMALAALRRSRAEQIPFARAFSNIVEYEGLTGMISVGYDGEVQRQFSVVEFSQGRLEEIVSNRKILAGREFDLVHADQVY